MNEVKYPHAPSTYSGATVPVYEFRILTGRRADWAVFAKALQGLRREALRDRFSGILVIRSASPTVARRVAMAARKTNVSYLQAEAYRTPQTDELIADAHDCYLRTLAHDDDEL